jgi:hypothetical protein
MIEYPISHCLSQLTLQSFDGGHVICEWQPSLVIDLLWNAFINHWFSRPRVDYRAVDLSGDCSDTPCQRWGQLGMDHLSKLVVHNSLLHLLKPELAAQLYPLFHTIVDNSDILFYSVSASSEPCQIGHCWLTTNVCSCWHPVICCFVSSVSMSVASSPAHMLEYGQSHHALNKLMNTSKKYCTRLLLCAILLWGF